MPRSATGFLLIPARVIQSGRWGSNPRHPAWEAGALPTELRPRVVKSTSEVTAPATHMITQSQRSGLNRRPPDYESGALPLSYAGEVTRNAQERTRTATPFGTTPSRWRVYQFHHLGDFSFLPASCSRAGLTGLEPATSGVTDRHSNQLSYSPNVLMTRLRLRQLLPQRLPSTSPINVSDQPNPST